MKKPFVIAAFLLVVSSLHAQKNDPCAPGENQFTAGQVPASFVDSRKSGEYIGTKQGNSQKQVTQPDGHKSIVRSLQDGVVKEKSRLMPLSGCDAGLPSDGSTTADLTTAGIPVATGHKLNSSFKGR